MIQDKINELQCCIIIPTYNNQNTLKTVLDEVLTFTSNVIVVDDGSTDQTSTILSEYSVITLLQYSPNKGKGYALRQSFKEALKQGYEYGITIDSDGQHFPSDIPLFVKAIEEQPDTLFIGSRNMNQEGVPSKSSFGNRFSNFWFWFETGIQLKDTQSGYRLYTLKKIPPRLWTKKFELEIEIIVRSAWRGVSVQNIPIQIKYDKKEERVSHFRPFKDFTRISILNTVLVVCTLLYIKPRNFFNRFKKKSLKAFIREDILGSNDSPKIKSLSLALGVFIGIIPIWGFQTVVVLFLAVSFRLNKLLAFTASNISIPPMIPLIVIASLQIGSWVFFTEITTEELTAVTKIKQHIIEYLIGSFILATLTACIVGVVSYLSLSLTEKKKK